MLDIPNLRGRRRMSIVLLSFAVGCFAVATVIAVMTHETVSLVPVAMGVVAIAQLILMLRKARGGRKAE